MPPVALGRKGSWPWARIPAPWPWTAGIGGAPTRVTSCSCSARAEAIYLRFLVSSAWIRVPLFRRAPKRCRRGTLCHAPHLRCLRRASFGGSGSLFFAISRDGITQHQPPLTCVTPGLAPIAQSAPHGKAQQPTARQAAGWLGAGSIVHLSYVMPAQLISFSRPLRHAKEQKLLRCLFATMWRPLAAPPA